jgi:phasin family protein
MSSLSPEQVATAQKAAVRDFHDVVSKCFEGVEKVVELHLQVVKSTLAETSESTGKALSAKDPQEWLALQASIAAQVAEKVQSYGRELIQIASGAQADFMQFAQARYEEQNRRVQTLVDELSKSAPAGSEAVITAWKSAITTSTTLSESLQQTARQTAKIAENNIKAVTASGPKAARTT